MKLNPNYQYKFSIILFLFLLVYSFDVNAQKKVKFEHLSIEHGLSQSSVTAIIQDSKGFMWFGTLDGLNKFDSNNNTIFRPIEKDSLSISDIAITCLFEDRFDRLWIGTQSQGLCVYDKIKKHFYRIKHIPANNHSLSNNFVTSLCEGKDNSIWVATANGLNRLFIDEKKILLSDSVYLEFRPNQIKSFRQYFSSGAIEVSLSNNTVNNVICDSQGTIWVATNNGVNKINPDTDEITVLKYADDKIQGSHFETNKVNTLYIDNKKTLWIGTDNGVYTYETLSKDTIYTESITPNLNLKKKRVTSIIEDKDGSIWMGTEKGGLSKYSMSENSFNRYEYDPANRYSLKVDNILTLYESRDHVLWIGTSLGGVNKWDRAAENIILYRNNPYNKKSVSSSQIRSIFEDSEGILWVGTVDGGLNKLDRSDYSFSSYQHSDDENSLSNNHIRAIAEGLDGYLWIGTEGGGLNRFDKKTNTFKHYNFEYDNLNCLSDDNVWSIFVDHNGIVWVGTKAGGLNEFNPKTEKFTHHKHYEDSLLSISDNHVTTIFEDKLGQLWVGTFGGGLNRYDKVKKSFIHYKHYERFDSLSIGSNRIYSVMQDKEGALWIGAKGSLNRYDYETETFTSYSQKDGLPNNTIMGVLEDHNNNLWISTNHGISKFDKSDLSNIRIKNFDVNDGLQSNEFLVGAYCKTRDGEMWFGGIHGLNSFYPERITENTIIPRIVITNFSISNNPEELDSAITEKKYIQLDYFNKDISFEFVALNYIYPEKSRYMYKMEEVGVETQWINNEARKHVNFTNMEPGHYVFRVKGSNSDQLWNHEGTAVYIYIKPPFWKTTWFIILEILAGVFLILGYVKWRTYKLQHDKIVLENSVRERTIEINQKKEEIQKQATQLEIANKELEVANVEIKKSSKLKEMFLANTSHEIRTPLNIIIGFTNLLLNSKLTPKQTTYLQRIKTSSNSLLVIINDILDFSKIEAGKLTLEVVEFELREVVSNVVNAIFVKANEKNIKFIHHIEGKIPKYVFGDPVRLNQILINLAGNAIKFTPDKGMVNIRINLVEEKEGIAKLSFKVIDSGIGMTEEQQSKIFESFTQASSDTTRKFGGTGLGLAIVKRLVELQDGELQVESIEGKGSVFTFVLSYKIADGSTVKNQAENHKILKVDGLDDIKLLLVDDNPINRALAVDTIKMYNDKIEIDEAENGRVAVEKAKIKDYDLIIMDLQMPEMDGYAATSFIRTKLNPPKSQVPILAMSAHAMKEEKDKCYTVGMNDYLTKPFVPEDLFNKLENLTGNKSIYKDKIEQKRAENKETVQPEVKSVYQFEYLNLSVLEKTYKGDKKKMDKILTLCFNNIPKQLDDLQQHYDTENWKLLRTVAHSLKTSLNYIGLKESREWAKTIEMNAAKEQALNNVPELIGNIKTKWAKAVVEIQTYLGNE